MIEKKMIARDAVNQTDTFKSKVTGKCQADEKYKKIPHCASVVYFARPYVDMKPEPSPVEGSLLSSRYLRSYMILLGCLLSKKEYRVRKV